MSLLIHNCSRSGLRAVCCAQPSISIEQGWEHPTVHSHQSRLSNAERTSTTADSWGHFTEWKTPDTREHMTYDSLFTNLIEQKSSFLGEKYRLSCFCWKETDRDETWWLDDRSVLWMGLWSHGWVKLVWTCWMVCFNWHISVHEIFLQKKKAKRKHEIVINKWHVETLEKVESLCLQCPLKAQQQTRGWCWTMGYVGGLTAHEENVIAS